MALREARLVYQDVSTEISPARKRISSERAASSRNEEGRLRGRARRARAWGWEIRFGWRGGKGGEWPQVPLASGV